jgi:asparagine synthase (glutamine-hydrolysing)
MLNAIRHRGPDDEGIYIAPQVALGHRRLSIIDLSNGHQPLSNEDDTVWIVFNGEIYNYQELREDLIGRGHRFRTKSDTEVIVHLYEEHGAACVEWLRGMFAFAIWDNREKTLFLARDRVGIKPLYYCKTDQAIVFGSEIKAILADPSIEREINPGAVDRFLSFYFVPGSETLLKGIYKLEPGNYLIARGAEITIRQYWDLRFSETPIGLREAEEKTVELLDEAVRLDMIADVPLGFLLSGGVDSTAMLGFSVGKTDAALNSYTLGFSEDEGVLADERPYARIAARRYGSNHREMTIKWQDFADFMPRYVWHMEEPVCEPQAVALYYVTKMAREDVKVLISGEGGDEAFAGYPIYRNLLWLERLKKATGPFNGLIGNSLLWANRCLHSPRIAKYAPLMDIPLSSYYYSRTSSPGKFFNAEIGSLYSKEFLNQIDKNESVALVKDFLRSQNGGTIVNAMLYVDTKTSLPDDLLLKADKMTMANSLELRVPFLDHKILEFAASLPASYKVHGFSTKYVAKRALGGLIPPEILKRKKVGFPVPYDMWMRNEMGPWLRDVLLDRKSVDRGYFQRNCIERILADDAQYGGFSKELLSLATLELWHREFYDTAVRQYA